MNGDKVKTRPWTDYYKGNFQAIQDHEYLAVTCPVTKRTSMSQFSFKSTWTIHERGKWVANEPEYYTPRFEGLKSETEALAKLAEL